MPVNTDLLKTLMECNDNSKLDFTLFLQEKTYALRDATISKSPTPVTRPTTRGGVYFAEKYAYRITGVIDDLAIIPLLSKAMLGPSTEFADICIRTQINQNDNHVGLNLLANLTGSVQSPSSVELNMILVGLESD